MYGDEKIPSGGIITGLGIIKNQFTMIIANDPEIKGGTYYPITVLFLKLISIYYSLF